MNKLLTKIVGVALGASLAVGVGVAAVNSNRDVVDSQVDALTNTGTVNLGATSGYWNPVSAGSWTSSTKSPATSTFTDNLSNTWTVTYTFSSYSMTTNSAYIQFGASSKPATSVVFTTTLSSAQTISAFSTKMGGFSGTAGTISLKVGDTQVGSGSLSGTSDVTVNATNTTTSGTVLTVSLTNISKGTKIYNFSYSYETGGASVTGVTITGTSTKTSYTTVDSWSNAGLTANVTMSDSSTYTGNIDWSYSPDDNPAAAVIANNNDEVTGYSLTATATADGESGSKTTTGVSVSYATVAEGLAAIPNSGNEVDGAIVQGIISHIDSIDTTTYYNATYYISDDGSRTDELEIYRGKGLNNADFTNSNDIKVGDTVLVYGNIKYYNGATKEFLQGNYLLDLDRPASSDPSITITEASFTMAVGDSDVTLHATSENIPDGGSVKWVSGTPAVATIGESTGVVHAVAAGSTEITAKIVDSGDNTVASNSITITVIEPVLSDGDSFIIYAEHNSSTYYLTGVSNDLGTCSDVKDDAAVFTAIEGSTSGQFAFKFGDDFLSYSGTSNKLYSSATNTTNATLWTVENNGTNDVIESVNVPGRKLQYNHNSDTGDNTKNRFACYASSQVGVFIEKIVVADPTTLVLNTKTLSLEAEEVSTALTFTTDSSGATFHWYSEDTSKATVSNGIVTAGTHTNTTVKIYVYFDTDGSGDFDPAEDLNDYCTVTIVAPTIDYTTVSYGGTGVKITSSNASTYLANGKKIIMTYNDEVVAGAYGSYIPATSTSVTFVSDAVTIGNGTAEVAITVLELETATGGFYLKTKDGKYLSHTSTSSSTGNFAKTDSATTIWSVTADGIYDINNQARATIRYNSGANPTRFKTYTPSTGSAIVLYSFVEYVDEAETYADLFLESGLCGSNDNTKAIASIWSDLKDTFNDDLSTGAQNVLKVASANPDSTDSIQKCLAKYDRVIYLHYTAEATSYPDFMNRVSGGYVTPLSANSGLHGIISSETNVTAIIVAISLLSVTAYGAYFFLRKKKEQ